MKTAALEPRPKKIAEFASVPSLTRKAMVTAALTAMLTDAAPACARFQ
jgi:hypothetical protein